MNEIRHLRLCDYVEKPWKNRRGSTQDILILPTGATDDSFDLRLSLTPIPAAADFSPFPGINRVITLIEGTALALEFTDHTDHLHCGDSLGFGPEHCPIGRPETPARVINVMARNGVWRIDHCAVQDRIPRQTSDDLATITALGTCCACRINGQDFTLSNLETLVVPQPALITVESRCLFARFSRC